MNGSFNSSAVGRESSITVAVRVRPFTSVEESNLVRNENESFFLSDGSFSSNEQTPTRKSYSAPRGVRKIINAVDDKMLIFDPPETNPLTKMQRNAFPHSKTSRIREHRFVFDKLFDVSASQEEVYQNTTRSLIDSVLDGFNATVFAYGATGCGKTHTISGTTTDPGVIFRTMKELYDKIELLVDDKIIEISLSFLEIYNETIRDLLKPDIDFKKLVLQEDTNSKISVTNLSSHKPNSVEDVMELILQGNKNRTCSPTEANATSSRSHAVLQINVVQRNRTADLKEAHTFATFSIIDLAGSERAAATKNRGARLNEGANINKSLLALGNCINALCDPRRKNHVPYRDSKLTRLLKFSLGGNCKTVMIVCVSPSSQHYDETLNTLKYADRVKEIKTKLIRNQHNLDRHVGSYLKMITQQRQEIDELKVRAAKVTDHAIERQMLTNSNNISQLFENIDILQNSLLKQNQERWKKYFILCKRKLLILQKIDCQNLLESTASVIQDNESLLQKHPQINVLMNLCDQLLSKIDNQIFELETQYAQPNDIDYIFNESAQQMLKKLKENEGWLEAYSTVFNQNVLSLRESLERDVLFNSSILFDYLVHELKDFSTCKVPEFMKLLLEGSASLDQIFGSVVASVELLVNGEYDTAVETYTSMFMQEKLKEQASNNGSRSVSTVSATTSSTEGESVSTFSKREYKRAPHSPLEGSPMRNFKKTISKKPITPKISPIRYRGKKIVRWDGPAGNPDTSMLESDVSMDELNNNSVLRSDIDESPLGENGMHSKSILNDDLDLKFDPTLDSPPIPILRSDSLNNEMNKIRKSRSEFNNSKLSINLNAKSKDTGDLDKPVSSKGLLLNKRASTRIINEEPSYIPGPPMNPDSERKKLNISPTNFMDKFGTYNSKLPTRNIDSNGNDSVE